MKLQGKVAVVTGAGRGLGKVCAIEMAREGAVVAVNDVDAAAVEQTVAEIEGLGAQACCASADITQRSQVEQMVGHVCDSCGRIDILANIAGGALGTASALDQIEDADWQKVLDVNLRGMFLCCQAAVSQMREQGSGGAIVNMSALAGRSFATLAGVHYAAAKAGVGGLTRQLARECGPWGVRVNAVAPTVVLSGERVEQLWLDKSEEHRRRVLEQIPLRRLAEPSEIARVVVFLASDDASYVTGATLDVNGGRFMC